MVKKKQKFSSTVFALLILAVSISSCKKIIDDPNPPLTTQGNVAFLTKVTVQSSNNNTELTQLAVDYDTKGNITSFLQDGGMFIVKRNANNQIESLTVDYTNTKSVRSAEYNSNNQIVKISSGNGTQIYSNSIITYNATGKIVKIATTNTSPNSSTSTSEYTWNGDNISKIVTDRTVEDFVSYDDKPNAYSSFKDNYLILFGTPTSKNNVTESNYSLDKGVATNRKYAFEYNTKGYPSLLKPTTKYYYAP